MASRRQIMALQELIHDKNRQIDRLTERVNALSVELCRATKSRQVIYLFSVCHIDDDLYSLLFRN